MSRSGLIARTDCLPSTARPVGLSRGSNHAQQWESFPRWIDVTAQPGDTSYRHLRRAPTDPASGKAVPAGAEAGFPGLSRIAPAATARCGQNPLWGLESGSGLRCGRPDGPAQLQGGQEPLSAAGQGPKQDGHRLGRGAPAVFVWAATGSSADTDP